MPSRTLHVERKSPQGRIVVKIPTTGIRDVNAPIVVAVDGDDVQTGGEEVGAFVLLYPGSVAEKAEPGHDWHASVDARGQRGCVATVKDISCEPELVERGHQRLGVDAIVIGATPSAIEIAAVSPVWIR